MTTVEDVPVLAPFETTAFDVNLRLSDGTTEIVKVMARGPVQAFMTALYTAQRWPQEKITMLRSIDH